MSIFIYPLVDFTESCLFCKKPKTWSSVFLLMNSKTRGIIAAVTICPDDRKKHTIDEIYDAIVEHSINELKEGMKGKKALKEKIS